MLLNYSYYPFNNKLEDIDESDLALLKDVSEGWYIDYKRQGLKIADFAKHISAFANQYGGWLVLGIDEAHGGNRTASDFIGISTKDIERISRDIREASSAHINPEVLYEEKVVHGPLYDIGLGNDRSILIIGIPMSKNTPHIHSSGRIYRRLADQSKPKEETERFILDDLWKRGQNEQEKLSKFLTKIPNLPASQESTSWAHIYFKPSQGQLGPNKPLSFSDFSRIAKNKDKSVLGVQAPMQAVYSTVDGFVARQIDNNDPSLATLTLKWLHDGGARFDIPLNTFDIDQFSSEHNQNKHSEAYYTLAREQGYSNMTIVDYSLFVQAVASMANSYLRMLSVTGDCRDIYSCFTLRNVFHTSPFIDSRRFMEKSKENSIPLILDKCIVFPQEPTENNMLFHEASKRDVDFNSYDEASTLPYSFSLPIIYRVFEASGIVADLDELAEDIEAWGFDKVNNVHVKK